MKYFVIALLLALPIQALGECTHAPFELVWAEKYRNGGSISVTVTDSVGCLVGFSYNGQIGSETRGRMYFRPLHQEGERYGLASVEEEEMILDLLSTVADTTVPRTKQNEVLEAGCGDFTEDKSCRYFGWLMELLKKKGRR
jgi:hypothetical protein